MNLLIKSVATIAARRELDVQQKLSQQGFDVIASTSATFVAHLRTALVKWAAVVKAAGLKSE